MMLLPVQIASGRARKPNSWVLQRIHSSAQPERCSAIIVSTKTDSITKSRSLETSRLLAATAANPSSSRHEVAIDRQAGAGQGGGAQGQHVQPLAAIGQPRPIALELLDIGQEIMRRQHRLGPLHVRIARAGSPSRCRIAAATSARWSADQARVDPVEGLAGPELHARSPPDRCGSAPCAASARRRPVSRPAPPRCACGHLRAPGRTRNRPSSISARISDSTRSICRHSSAVSNPTCWSMSRMGDRTPDILLEESTVEGDRFRERLHATVGLLSEPATPGLTGHAWSSRHRRRLHKVLAFTDSV